MPGHVAGLVTASSGVVPEVPASDEDHGVHWVRGSGPGRKRIRLNRKTLAHFTGFCSSFSADHLCFSS